MYQVLLNKTLHNRDETAGNMPAVFLLPERLLTVSLHYEKTTDSSLGIDSGQLRSGAKSNLGLC